MSNSARLLYVHPAGHLNDLVVPAGALSCMNAVSVDKLGRYAFEVSEDELRDAAVIAIDLHWALGLSGFEPLLADLRRVNPSVPVIVGGISASHWARELLARYAIDYVVCGDSETSFAALVLALLEGKRPHGLANVFGRGLPEPVRTRMSAAEFDVTDPLTADWFPTFARCSDWDAAAFPAGRTIPVARGCPLRCPECYGSFAATFGPGYLLRSAAATVALLERAARMGVRNLRLFFGKPPSPRTAELMQAIARAGPFSFTNEVGFYLCTPVAAAELAALAAAFPAGLALSAVPPEQHVPALAPRQRELEDCDWHTMARVAAKGHTLTLDLWTTRPERLAELRRDYGVTESSRVKVSSAAVWSVTRPLDAITTPSFDDVRVAMLPAWTFYAARALSPALSTLLAPFCFLDELAGAPEEAACPRPPLSEFFELIYDSWRRHRLPVLPGLGFVACAVDDVVEAPVASTTATPQGTRLHGALTYLAPGVVPDVSRRGPLLVESRDRKGVTLQAGIELDSSARAIVLLPTIGRPGRSSPQADRALLAQGAVALLVPPSSSGAHTLELAVRMQEVSVALLDSKGALVARGRAELGYFRHPRLTTALADG